MNLFSRIAEWIGSVFAPRPAGGREPARAPKPLPPVVFPAITFAEKPPPNTEVMAGQLYYVVNGEKAKWILFKCPCGCGDVVTLSAQTAHQPHWRLTRTQPGRPTLYPSVWRDKGCMSHFWLRDGRVELCFDTGTHPDLRTSR